MTQTQGSVEMASSTLLLSTGWAGSSGGSDAGRPLTSVATCGAGHRVLTKADQTFKRTQRRYILFGWEYENS